MTQQIATIERANAGQAYRPSFAELLECEDRELLREPLRRWLLKRDHRESASFVYETWLKIGGEPQLIRESLTEWLAKHAATMSASYLYKAWFRTTGDVEPVRDAIGVWLAKHGQAEKAHFIYQGWLDAGGERELVAGAVSAGSKSTARVPMRASCMRRG